MSAKDKNEGFTELLAAVDAAKALRKAYEEYGRASLVVAFYDHTDLLTYGGSSDSFQKTVEILLTGGKPVGILRNSVKHKNNGKYTICALPRYRRHKLTRRYLKVVCSLWTQSYPSRKIFATTGTGNFWDACVSVRRRYPAPRFEAGGIRPSRNRV
jgi:hypothetical protein